MALFHSTLNDAIDSVKRGNIQKALDILKKHKQDELEEQEYIESTLYAVKIYLENYASHMNKAIELLSKSPPSEADKTSSEGHIWKCKENIDAFEQNIKQLLQKEQSFQ